MPLPHLSDYPPAWDEHARRKGCMIYAWDGGDKVLVRHNPCGKLMVTDVFTLLAARPNCSTCHSHRWVSVCKWSGITFVGPAEHPEYLLIRLPCGHEVVRRQDLLESYNLSNSPRRCPGCQKKRDAEQAWARGWKLLRHDPEHNPRYRLYRHEDCGHIQRIARARMRSGGLTCPRCSPGWRREPSFLYLGRLPLANGMTAIKLGFSRNPSERLRHLRNKHSQHGQIRYTVSVRTGHEAFTQETAMHALARHAYPGAVLERTAFDGEVRVTSELYHRWFEPILMSWLGEIEKGARFRRPLPARPQHHARRRRKRGMPQNQTSHT